MKKYLTIILFLFACSAYNQSVDIYFCYKKAEESFPLIKQKQVFQKAEEYKTKSLNSNYMPQVYLNAQFSFQSDVTQLPIKIPWVNIAEQSKDNYKATLDINQIIWDGGTISYQKEFESLVYKNEIQNVEVEMNKIKERINQHYFNILICKKTKELLESIKYDIQLKLKKIESSVKYGFLNESNADNLRAEIFKIDQKIIEIEATENSNILMLSELCSFDFHNFKSFILPEISLTGLNYENNRPELLTFDINKNKLSVQQKILSSKLYPKIFAFGQLGYGKPGLNLLSDDFQSFYIVGAKLSWNIWNWNQTSTEKKIIDLQDRLISNYKEVFLLNSKISWIRDKIELEKFQALIIKDKEIIELKSKVAKASSSQFDSGFITSSDYLNDVNAETQAKINYEIHKIQFEKAKFDYLINIGKL